jgi:hypothetical protein
MVSNAIFKKIICLLIVFGAIAVEARAQTTAFTYQGKLTENSAPANGACWILLVGNSGNLGVAPITCP